MFQIKKGTFKNLFIVIIIVFSILTISFSILSCNLIARKWGGTMTVKLEPNKKLINVTWKEKSLWILTKPMTIHDKAETYSFKEDSTFGVLEGEVVIIETAR